MDIVVVTASSQEVWKGEHVLIVAQLLLVELVLLQVAELVELVMELGNLVGQLADSGHLDGARPIRVHESLAEGQVLNVRLAQLIMRVIVRDVEVRRLHTTNGRLLWNKEEIIALVVGVLDQVGVNDGTWWWVNDLTSVLAEHPLVDSLVDDNESDLGRIHLVVQAIESFLDLHDFFFDDVLPLLLTGAISVDYESVWQSTTVHLKIIECFSEALVQIFFDDLLVLWLQNDVGVMTGERRVGGEDATDD